ncbi:MAG: class I SAM-dependent methyltransferase [Candidatus Tectomicrobia bacterium]|uniref:Class I SAM-dependent methyltransferase n=1 Tax=Tectimicrobiota bacterium TaxID=2528274 RepID=A0A933GNP2_UNCTE|nr:class I SAM-dependent methyltransferase [Candidatus Tectomicrobia bacterium]
MNPSLTAKKKWNRNARVYDLMTFMETRGRSAAVKRDMLAICQGKILEVGIGTGHNLQFYPRNISIIGVDISDAMLRKAKRKLTELGGKATLICMDGENLAFRDASFDFVVSTCVFCSIPDPVEGLQEIARVLKPEGKLLMFEHVLSKKKLIAFIQNLLNPIMVKMGPNINRDTIGNIKRAHLEVIKEENVMLGDIFKRIDAVPLRPTPV